MVTTIKIDVKGLTRVKKLFRKLTLVPSKIPNAIRDIGYTYVRDLKNSAFNAGIRPFTGEIYGSGIQWRQRPKGKVGSLFINNRYIMLDSMKPHWVALKPTRKRLLLWAQQASDDFISEKATLILSGVKIPNRSIFVRPHPFIVRGMIRADKKIGPIINKHVKMAFA